MKSVNISVLLGQNIQSCWCFSHLYAAKFRLAPYIHKTDLNVNLATVGERQYYVYRYEGNSNDLEHAIVLISYPKEAFWFDQSPACFRYQSPHAGYTGLLSGALVC